MLRVGGIGGVLGGGAALSVVDGAGVGAASVAVSSTLTGGRSARDRRPGRRPGRRPDR